MVIIQKHTTKEPITLIGEQAGVCWGANTDNSLKNYKRGLKCLASGHGRTFEFPSVYMILDGYSARVIREWYTHIGGLPSRLQSSTRYIDYAKGFEYVTPPSIKNKLSTDTIYQCCMENIQTCMKQLEELGAPREDIAMCLPLGMTTKVTCKHNLRNLLDMAQQRKCSRAYWEFRGLFADIEKALSSYSDEWKILVENYFKVKCDILGHCPEEYSCGRKDKL